MSSQLLKGKTEVAGVEVPKPVEQGKQSIQVQKEPFKMIDHIPCLYLPYDEGSNKIILYFHGNAEDVGLAFDLLYLVGQRLQMHVLAVEYPGYGLYKNQGPDETIMKEDALTIYDYLTTVCGLQESDIILFGRSMGSGPSSYLSKVRKPYSLILMSAYTSIQNAAKSILGWASFLGFIVQERFRNIDMLREAQCPVFIVHGKKDTLIPCAHSEELFAACGQPCYLHMPHQMDHNEFLMDEDLIQPINAFLNQVEKRKKLIGQVAKSHRPYRSDADYQEILLKALGDMKGPVKEEETDILNPFMDKKERSRRKYSFKTKNFDVRLEDVQEYESMALSQEKGGSIDTQAETSPSMTKSGKLVHFELKK